MVQQQRVSELRRSGQVSRGGRPAEHSQHPLAASIADLIEDGPVALAGTSGPDEEKIGGEGHLASPVARGQVDVADGPVLFKLRVDLEEDFPLDHLIGSRRGETAALQNLSAVPHLHADHRRNSKLSQKQPQTEHA